ncbi:MAG: hypothetical protein LBS36_07630 [Oscillospiraceae bacterium]|jgi:hypothetical protein|nr:hypothetical protein [Oscillospiraceae bacterium]
MSNNEDREVEFFDLNKSMRQTKVPLICIYKHPKDYPDKYVARLWDRNIPTQIMATSETLEGIREKIPEGMVRLNRDATDDPVIVETWI